jgi:sugar phosphate isomerase/epimerase
MNNVPISICSFSFHRLLNEGKQDIFQYIADCKGYGCAALDPWNAHLAGVQQPGVVAHAGGNPQDAKLPPIDDEMLNKVKAAAESAGIPFGCIAVDGAHIYEADPIVRSANRALAYRWIDIAATLGAKQMRIDCGGPAELPGDVFEIIKDGYNDIISRAGDKGIEILIENHWGPSLHPDKVVQLVENINGLGLLFDTNNWAPGKQQQGWELCAKYAKACHIKTFMMDEDGNEGTLDLKPAFDKLLETGYKGTWGIESCPKEVDEYEGVRRTIILINKILSDK